MSCPRWNALVARRDADPQAVEAAWDDALVHFDSGCPLCREDALDAEPTLLFRQMPILEVDDEDIAAMQQAVSTLCRSREIDPAQQATRRSWRGRGLAQQLRRPWLQAATVASLVAGSFWLTGGGATNTLSDSVSQPAVQVSAVNGASSPAHDDLAGYDAIQLPLVEDVDPTVGELIQVVDDEISIVMVIAQAEEPQDV